MQDIFEVAGQFSAFSLEFYDLVHLETGIIKEEVEACRMDYKFY